MDLTTLTAISPIDGRYRNKSVDLTNSFSELALIKYRLIVEVRWFQHLSNVKELEELPCLKESDHNFLNTLIETFSEQDGAEVKAIELETNHDVKAVEYYLKKKISDITTLSPFSEFIHFACTSEDINNLAYALMLKDGISQVIEPNLDKLIDILTKLATSLAEVSMLSRTHGQAASPTTMGKEIANTVARLKKSSSALSKVEYFGKMNGAVGNYNAHLVAYPNLDWQKITEEFITSLGLNKNTYTTQIEPHDYMAELFHLVSRTNTILIDFCRDIWEYISLGYFKQITIAGEVGSSTMPHKVNPIDFENSEGNLGLANAILNYLSGKLPISRMQRDLTDSTTLRNVGVGLAYTLIALESLFKGLAKLEINETILNRDLNANWEVLAEPIQTVMRKHGLDDSYERLKSFTRGKSISKETLQDFIKSLELPDEAKSQLLKLTPKNYIGNADLQANDLR